MSSITKSTIVKVPSPKAYAMCADFEHFPDFMDDLESVTFDALDNQRTQVTVMMDYISPAGKVGEAGAHLVANPERRLEADLKRFKVRAESTAFNN